MSADDTKLIIAPVGIHITFLLSAIAIAADLVMSPGPAHARENARSRCNLSGALAGVAERGSRLRTYMPRKV